MSQWISLMEYAARHSVSLSTLRRYIKSKKVEYRLDQGRYLILDRPVAATEQIQETREADGERTREIARELSLEMLRQKDLTIDSLRTQLKKAQEEIAELKTLIAFYEDPARPSQLEA